jgi:hypothetical protein
MIDNLRVQAESNRSVVEDLIEQRRRQQEDVQALTHESVRAYEDFLNALFSYYRTNFKQNDGEIRR